MLIVCTANICRSPMAEGILADRLAGVPELQPVSSAGLLAGGFPADADAVSALATRGLDISSHVSRQLTAEMVEEADLVLGMERRHVREAVVMVPSSLPRAFTLRELLRRGRAVGPRRPGQTVGEWLAEVGSGRTPADLFANGSDDVADPIGMSSRWFDRLAGELTALADELAALIGPGASGGD